MLSHIGTAALVVPLRMFVDMRASEAGFLVNSGCFSAFFVLNAVTELSRLRRLALTRSLLLDPIQSLPCEEADEEEDTTPAGAAGVGAGSEEKAALSNSSSSSGSRREKPPVSWPSAGQVEVQDVWARYAPELPPVLCGVSLCVRPGEKIGVVGRTGSGKSSLLAAIARTIQPYKGRMAIDGLDLARVPLRELRSRGVTVVTQDPLLFAGTLRKNLDPFGEFSENELREVLFRVKLYDFADQSMSGWSDDGSSSGSNEDNGDEAERISLRDSFKKDRVSFEGDRGSLKAERGSLRGKIRRRRRRVSKKGPLDLMIAERGNNLSAGQKQLLAIAQAILRKPRVLLLDEATAALDRASEAAIEATIQQEFKGVTTILVAHRLSSVLSSDRVLVMQDGRVGELGAPAVLLQDANGLLSQLVQAQQQGKPL